MANFEKYAPLLRRFEGGFVNDPSDKGGATMAGVTIKTYRAYFGASKTVEDLKNISDAEWRYIMKRYWDACQGDSIVNQSVAEIFVDWYVNAGGSAVRKFQYAFGLKSDGIVGRKTLAALNDPDARTTFNRIKSARESYYRKLVITTPSNSKFLKGWLNRVAAFVFVP